ncbi:MAG TPA: hypothetical protein VGI19_09545 [Candidatus Cybelea sp.]|jgi:hypothetical protein
MRRSCAIRGSVSPSIDIHAEFFPVETTNAWYNVIYFTLSVAGRPDDSRRHAIDAAMQARHGRATWRVNPVAGRSYALLEAPSPFDPAEIAMAPGESIYDTAIIALAVSPTVPEALPYLVDALGGEGGPAGVLAVRPCGEGLIVEWDPRISGARVVSAVIDVELARFESGRRAELLSALPPNVLASVAADGLQTPELTADRVLELLIER